MWKPILLFLAFIFSGLILCILLINNAGLICKPEQQRIEYQGQGEGKQSNTSNKNGESSGNIILSFKLTQSESQQEKAQQTADKKGWFQEGWWNKFFCELKISDVAIVFFTYCLVVVGAFQAWYLLRTMRETAIAAKATKDALDHTIDTDVITQRAYLARRSVNSVDVKPFATDDGEKYIRFEYTPVWENNGATPAINVTFCALKPIICSDDIPVGTKPEVIQMGALPKIAIGARQMMAGGTVAVAIEDLIKCSRRECKIFLIFRLEYNDIFRDTPLRIVQYCEELRFSGVDPVSDNPLPIGSIWPFMLYGDARFQIYS